MQTTDDRKDEASQLRPNDDNTFETVRVGLREATLAKRKKDRTSAWNKNRASLGEFSRNEFFPTDYVNEKAKLLRKKKISYQDYRYLPNALIQVRSVDTIDKSCWTTQHYPCKSYVRSQCS